MNFLNFRNLFVGLPIVILGQIITLVPWVNGQPKAHIWSETDCNAARRSYQFEQYGFTPFAFADDGSSTIVAVNALLPTTQNVDRLMEDLANRLRELESSEYLEVNGVQWFRPSASDAAGTYRLSYIGEGGVRKEVIFSRNNEAARYSSVSIVFSPLTSALDLKIFTDMMSFLSARYGVRALPFDGSQDSVIDFRHPRVTEIAFFLFGLRMLEPHLRGARKGSGAEKQTVERLVGSAEELQGVVHATLPPMSAQCL